MSGTTADKLNYLKGTKELLRQEINNDFPDLNLSTSVAFRQYPSKMSSSQFWMDAWISGGIVYSIVYNGTSSFTTGYRNFKNISMPNVSSAKFNDITADTVVIGGPDDHLTSIIFSGSTVEKVYVNNLKRIDLSSKDASLCDGGSALREIHLPRVINVAGKKGFLSSTYAIRSRVIYLPRVAKMGNYALKGFSNGGYFHIGTELSTVCDLTSSTGIEAATNIYVPASLVASYKTATNWSSYSNIIVAEPGT